MVVSPKEGSPSHHGCFTSGVQKTSCQAKPDGHPGHPGPGFPMPKMSIVNFGVEITNWIRHFAATFGTAGRPGPRPILVAIESSLIEALLLGVCLRHGAPAFGAPRNVLKICWKMVVWPSKMMEFPNQYTSLIGIWDTSGYTTMNRIFGWKWGLPHKWFKMDISNVEN